MIPYLFFTLGSAPAAISAWTAATRPLATARSNGVDDLLSSVCTRARAEIRASAVSALPAAAARWTGARPSLLCALT